MKIGISTLITQSSPPLSRLSREVEARGFDSLWLPEHSHIPMDSVYPDGRPVTREYGHTLDPFAVLAAVAMQTTRLMLATGVCLLTQRDTIQTAKSVATVDHLAQGRFLFGVGGGWNRPELENHGTDYRSRFRKLTEQIDAMKTIWTHDQPEFHGRFVEFDPMWCWPKPFQCPHPPIYLGGESEHTLERVVTHGDGWLPRARNPAAVLDGILQLHRISEAAGRDPKLIRISAIGVTPSVAAITPLQEAGIERVVLTLPGDSERSALEKLDSYAALVHAFQ